MAHWTRAGLALVLISWQVPWTRAHFNMLLPESASIKKNEEITIVYQWGHPFEHQLFDAPLPESFSVVSPDGEKTDLKARLNKIEQQVGQDKKVAAFHVRFKSSVRGDYVFVLNSPPIWMEEDQEFLQD